MRSPVPGLVALGFVALASAQENARPRVFVPDSHSWALYGGFGAKGAGGGVLGGGARPQTAEVIKTVGDRCPEVIVTMNQQKADYILLLEHEGGKGALRKDNKFAVFRKDGDALKSGSTRTLGNAVKDACLAITKDWEKLPEAGAKERYRSRLTNSVLPHRGSRGTGTERRSGGPRTPRRGSAPPPFGAFAPRWVSRSLIVAVGATAEAALSVRHTTPEPPNEGS